MGEEELWKHNSAFIIHSSILHVRTHWEEALKVLKLYAQKKTNNTICDSNTPLDKEEVQTQNLTAIEITWLIDTDYMSNASKEHIFLQLRIIFLVRMLSSFSINKKKKFSWIDKMINSSEGNTTVENYCISNYRRLQSKWSYWCRLNHRRSKWRKRFS